MFNRSMLSVFNVSPRRELQQAPLQLRWPRAQTQAQPPGPGPLSSRAPQPPAAVRLFLTVGDEPAHWRATPGSLPMQRFCTRRERGRLVHQAPWRTSAQQRLRRGRHRRHCPPQQQHPMPPLRIGDSGPREVGQIRPDSPSVESHLRLDSRGLGTCGGPVKEAGCI